MIQKHFAFSEPTLFDYSFTHRGGIFPSRATQAKFDFDETGQKYFCFRSTGTGPKKHGKGSRQPSTIMTAKAAFGSAVPGSFAAVVVEKEESQ